MRDRQPRLGISKAQSHHVQKLLLLLIESFEVGLVLVIQSCVYFPRISRCLFHCPREKSERLNCNLGEISIKMHLCHTQTQIPPLLPVDFLQPILANVADDE